LLIDFIALNEHDPLQNMSFP